MPLPEVPADHADDDLERAFVILARQQLGDLADRLAKAPARPPAALGLEREIAAARLAWRADLAPLGAPNRRQQLNRNVAIVNALEQQIIAAVPKPGSGATQEPFGSDRLAQLARVVSTACSVADDAKDTVIGDVFGIPHVQEARERLREISAILKWRLAQTSPDAVVLKGGFVLDTALPDTMAALAFGSGKEGYIRVRPSAFAMDEREFAKDLVHEASHQMQQPTVDFAYRTGGFFLLLPASLALRNAAHFEHVAAKVLSCQPCKTPADGGFQSKALVALQFKVTRAWVRAWDLTTPGPGLRPVVALIHADPDKVGGEVCMAVFKALFAAMEAVMDCVTKRTTLTFAQQEGLTVQQDGAVRVTVKQARPTPAAAAATELICHHLSSTGRIGFDTLDLATYIDGIAAHDRPSLTAELAAFFTWVDSDPVG